MSTDQIFPSWQQYDLTVLREELIVYTTKDSYGGSAEAQIDNINAQSASWFKNGGDILRGGGQVFKPSSSYRIKTIKLKMYRDVGYSESFLVEVLSGYTTICSGTFSSAAMSTVSPGEWYEISLGVGADLISGEYYIIHVTPTSSDSTWPALHIWFRGVNPGGYPDGASLYYDGYNWVSGPTDLVFEILGY